MTSPIIMFMNMKGGVGKTALATNFAYDLSWYYDKDALVIDFDPQANASLALLGPERYFDRLEKGQSLAAVLTPGVAPNDPFTVVQSPSHTAAALDDVVVNVRRWTMRGPEGGVIDAGKVDLVPGDLDLMRLALNPLSIDLEHRLTARWLNLLKQARLKYDCVIIDCHPAGSFFTKAAVLGSDVVIVPVTTDGYAEAGLNMMRQFIDTWSAAGGASEYFVVFNDAQGEWDQAAENTIRLDKRHADRILSPRIPHSKLIRNVVRSRKFVREQKVANRYAVSRVLNRLTRNLVSRLVDAGVLNSTWEAQR